ncbi:MAG: hypothetical protein AAF748_16700 [Pseudomonadota bacterium]
MSGKQRWITAALKEAALTEVKMPWTRGKIRTAFIEKRLSVPKGAEMTKKAAAARG